MKSAATFLSDSSYPAPWLDADPQFECFEHVDTAVCHCDLCDAVRRAQVQQLSAAYLERFAAIEAANEQRSRATTIIPPGRRARKVAV